ncbi:unnamed protein product [Arctogadus glacialis]
MTDRLLSRPWAAVRSLGWTNRQCEQRQTDPIRLHALTLKQGGNGYLRSVIKQEFSSRPPPWCVLDASLSLPVFVSRPISLRDADPGLENRDHSWNRQDRRRPVRESLRVDTLPENLTHVVVRRLSFSL